MWEKTSLPKKRFDNFLRISLSDTKKRETGREIETHRQRDRDIDKVTEKHRERQRDRMR